MAKIDELLEFWNEGSNKDRFSADKEDFLRSKNFASGNGFYSVSSKVWSTQRARIYADFISPVVTGIVAMLELAPPEITGFEFDRKILSDVLRELLCDGKSFILAYNKGDKLKIKKLSNLQTYMSEDFSKAIHVSKITREKAEARGIKFGGADKILIDAFASTLEVGKNETYLLTFYEKTESGVEVSEFIGKEQAGKTAKLNLRHLPVVEFFGELTQVNNRPNHRGIYYKARGIITQISFLLSYIQEKTATAPNVQFLVAEETMGDNTQQWTELNGEPKAMLTYKSRDTLDGGANAYPPPMPLSQDLQLSGVLQILQMNLELLRGIMGGDMAGEGKSHETAESVLLRREKKDASGNAYIRSMLSGLETLAEVLTDYHALLGQPVHCEVVDRYFVKMKQNRDAETILSLMQIAAKSPAFAAALAEKTDLDDQTKQQVIAATNVQNLLDKSAEMELQLQQAAAQIQQLQQQLENASKQNMQLENSINAQVWAAQVRAETELQKTLIQNETELLKIQVQKEESAVDFKLRFEEMSRRATETFAKIAKEA